MSQNIGHSDRLPYDQCAYDYYTEKSVGPGIYRMNPINIHHPTNCTSTLMHTRGQTHGVSTVVGNVVAPKQANVDVESILSNRSVLQSKCKDGNFNDIDVTKVKLQHVPQCNSNLDPVATRLTDPASGFREIAINRFYDIPSNPQNHIFYDFGINTSQEAKDNYWAPVDKPFDQSAAFPKPQKGNNRVCKFNCTQ